MSRSVLLCALLLASCRGRDDDAPSRDPSTAAPAKTAQKADASVDAIADAADADADAIDADAAIVLPAVDTSCAVDTDCAVTVFAPSGPYTCCWWCGTTPGNVAWVTSVDAICKATPPKSCPALACPMGPMHARCDKGRCVGVF